MSYETALQWALDHAPPQDYDSFNDWYRAVENKMNTPNIMSNPVFNRMLENAWRDITGTDSEDRVIQRVPSREQPVQIQNQRTFLSPRQQPQTQEEQRIIPPTGRAPELLRPIPLSSVEERRLTEFEKIKKFFGRLNPLRRR